MSVTKIQALASPSYFPYAPEVLSLFRGTELHHPLDLYGDDITNDIVLVREQRGGSKLLILLQSDHTGWKTRLDIKTRLERVIRKFKEKGAISEKTALPLKELDLPLFFKHVVRSTRGQNLPFVEVDGKYYLDEERAKEIEGGGMILPPPPFRKWARHTSRVPRGFLRYRVLRLLEKQPMSGSEITSTIEKATGGRWKPSPGSLYGEKGLLNSLAEEGVIEELPLEGGIKRYRMTELGHALMEEENELAAEIREKLRSGPFPFVPFLNAPPELQSVRESFRRIFEASFAIHAELAEDMDADVAKEVTKILTSAAKKLEKMAESYKHE
ncbi:PadR family transcriptional regulator [Candidatus Thorarchaeota archaeon]|nr:MAG: PadR family transcriptional regulator [Candidatus Thorarchaeota archaeon]